MFYLFAMTAYRRYKGCAQVRDTTQKLFVLVCWDCRRIGVYPRQRFIELVGEATYLPDAKFLVARQVCPKAVDEHALLFDRCMIQYHGLDAMRRAKAGGLNDV